jgi:hypothetical protein
MIHKYHIYWDKHFGDFFGTRKNGEIALICYRGFRYLFGKGVGTYQLEVRTTDPKNKNRGWIKRYFSGSVLQRSEKAHNFTGLTDSVLSELRDIVGPTHKAPVWFRVKEL